MLPAFGTRTCPPVERAACGAVGTGTSSQPSSTRRPMSVLLLLIATCMRGVSGAWSIPPGHKTCKKHCGNLGGYCDEAVMQAKNGDVDTSAKLVALILRSARPSPARPHTCTERTRPSSHIAASEISHPATAAWAVRSTLPLYVTGPSARLRM